MDYQIVFRNHHYSLLAVIISLLIFSFLPHSLAIVNRDLVLTPKQGLQLSGKRIFYEESISSNSNSNSNDVLHNNNFNNNDSVLIRPWERTLKHVTYLTLFTNAPNGIITGNFSKVKEYNDFLQSTYIRSQNPHDSRFGDIVTLAQGRLEDMSNGSYRFIEGNCDYECARESNIVAMWHVQKIRHRDTADRKYHYEMKFSISPWTAKTPTETLVRGGPNKRTIMDEKRNNIQTFIQKEDDYPYSFSKIVSGRDEDFADRRYDAARNFRHVNQYHPSPPQQQLQQVTPIPQSTFLRGVYQPHPYPQPHPHQPAPPTPHQIPLPERLNMGEYYKGGYVPKGSSKIELFPSLLNMMFGKPQNFLAPAPTTTRSVMYQMKFPRPEIYTLPQHPPQEFPNFPEYHHHSQEHFTQKMSTQNPSPITHHYHHHFFMPNNSIGNNIEQAIHHSGEHKIINSPETFQNEVTEVVVTPIPYGTNLYDEQHTTTLRQFNFPQQQNLPQQNFPQQNIHMQQQYPQQQQNYHQLQNANMPPAPQKFSFPPTQIEQHRVVHVTPAPPLRKPQYQHYYQNRPLTVPPEYTTAHVPLFISYPAPVHEEERADVPTPRNKPFVHSESLDDIVHYSEPDPLYAHDNQQEQVEDEKYNLTGEEQPGNNPEPQLESPEHYEHPHNENEREKDTSKEHTDSIEAQLLAPKKNDHHQSDEAHQQEDSTQSQTQQHQLEQKTSQTATSIKISTEKTTSNTIKTESSNMIVTATNKPKTTFPSRVQRISLKTATTTSSTTSTPTTTTTSPKKTKLTTTEKLSTSTTLKPKKNFVSTSSTESPLRTISRYRNSYSRSSTSTTTSTEKPVLKWKPRRKTSNAKSMTMMNSNNSTTQETQIEEDVNVNDDDDDDEIKPKESNNRSVTKLFMFPSTTTEMKPEPTTEISNDITTSTSTLSSLPSQSPAATQSDIEIYEVLTQKSVSKSVSVKVGSNGEEIPVIIDDTENEVKNV